MQHYASKRVLLSVVGIVLFVGLQANHECVFNATISLLKRVYLKRITRVNNAKCTITVDDMSRD